MLSIINVAYPFAAVNEDPVGGAEQIVAALDRALVRGGHTSTVIACDGSRVAGRLLAIPAHTGNIDDDARARSAASVKAAIAARLAQSEVDVLHLHGIDFLDYLPDPEVIAESGARIVVTLHLPLDWYPKRALHPDDRFEPVCVSSSQRAASPSAADFRVIDNGVDLQRYQPSASKGDYALALGRVCPEKGLDLALAAARRADAELVVAGMVFPHSAHQLYFDERVSPLLDAKRRFIGPSAGPAKRELLARARCLVVASRAQETSSLVAMEALACGTPVVALRRGALPDIIEHGRTGFLVEDEAEMAAAIRASAQLRPADCRAAAELRFCSARMSREYLDLYEARSARAHQPPGHAAALDVEVITSDADAHSLVPEWSELCDADLSATPFQRPEWLLAWERHLGRGERHLIAVRRGARLIGVLPLRQHGTSISLTGAGVSDYLDLVCEPGAAPEVLRAVASHLSKSRQTWHELSFDALRANSPLLRLALDARFSDELTAATPSPVLALPSSLPPKLAYYRRRLSRAGSPAWTMATAADVAHLMQTLFVLHGARWRERQQPGVLAEADVQAFHREAAPALARRGLLRLYALELGASIAGVLYAFADHGRVHYYLSGFDPELATYSPGLLLIAHAVEHAAESGAREFDFLRGREPYKYAWGAVDRPAYQRRIRHKATL